MSAAALMPQRGFIMNMKMLFGVALIVVLTLVSCDGKKSGGGNSNTDNTGRVSQSNYNGTWLVFERKSYGSVKFRFVIDSNSFSIKDESGEYLTLSPTKWTAVKQEQEEDMLENLNAQYNNDGYSIFGNISVNNTGYISVNTNGDILTSETVLIFLNKTDPSKAMIFWPGEGIFFLSKL
jgi:hypothetical protein